MADDKRSSAERLKSKMAEDDGSSLAGAAKKPENSRRGDRQPQTARAMLEDNKLFMLRKKEEQALVRQKSRERIDKALAGEQKSLEADKAKKASRRLAQQELARYYKSRIAENEISKANAYKTKVDAGACTTYFPYTEGEHINQTRKAQMALMREEMRVHLEEQRNTKPGKAGRQEHLYPPSESAAPIDRLGAAEPEDKRADTPISGQPKFLTRPNAHMSRRTQDEHVRRALEDKVQRTKEELEKLTMKRQMEAQAWEEGMMVNDALRYDSTESKNSEKHQNAKYLRAQMVEREERKRQEKQDRQAEVAGYWGPDEKECPGMETHLRNNIDLIKQMEVNQHRKLAERSRRLVQEKNLVVNSISEIAKDREAEQMKLALHREVLVTTWDSQRKIRDVMNRIELQA